MAEVVQMAAEMNLAGSGESENGSNQGNFAPPTGRFVPESAPRTSTGGYSTGPRAVRGRGARGGSQGTGGSQDFSPSYGPGEGGQADALKNMNKFVPDKENGENAGNKKGMNEYTPILDMISQSEGTTKHGYNDAFGHQLHGDLSQMSVSQVREAQRGQSGSSAVGRYQMMGATIDDAINKKIIKPDEKFTPELQDRLAKWKLKDRGYEDWKSGKIDNQTFMHNMSKEWAGMTDPNTGHGFYPGQNAGFSVDTQEKALNTSKDVREHPEKYKEENDTNKPKNNSNIQMAKGKPDTQSKTSPSDYGPVTDYSKAVEKAEDQGRSSGSAVEKFKSIEGMSGYNPEQKAKIEQYLKDGGHSLNARDQAWCAAAVGSSLNQAGYKNVPTGLEKGGSGDLAGAYRNWGEQVSSKDHVKADDVGMFHRGGHYYHVGILTGKEKGNQVEVMQGNTTDPQGRLKYATRKWVNRDILDIHRARPEDMPDKKETGPDFDMAKTKKIPYEGRINGGFDVAKGRNVPFTGSIKDHGGSRSDAPGINGETGDGRKPIGGTMLFAQGMTSRMSEKEQANVTNAARQYAELRGQKFESLNISGDNKGAQERALLERMKKGDVTGIYGFSGGGYSSRDALNNPNLDPKLRAKIQDSTFIGAPGTGEAVHGLQNPPNIYNPPRGQHTQGPDQFLEQQKKIEEESRKKTPSKGGSNIPSGFTGYTPAGQGGSGDRLGEIGKQGQVGTGGSPTKEGGGDSPAKEGGGSSPANESGSKTGDRLAEHGKAEQAKSHGGGTPHPHSAGSPSSKMANRTHQTPASKQAPGGSHGASQESGHSDWIKSAGGYNSPQDKQVGSSWLVAHGYINHGKPMNNIKFGGK